MATDREVRALVLSEERRQKRTVSLIASENYASRESLAVEGSLLANKLTEGYLGERECAGCEVMDQVEALAVERAKKLFGADHANVQSLSATIANLAVYLAVLEPGDKVLGMDLAVGHLSHGNPQHASGRWFSFVHYGVDRETERIDYEALGALARRERPRLIIAGASNYPRAIDFAPFGEIARESGADLLADIAHPAGLIAAGLHPSPVPFADFVTSSTHKTLRGPRGGGLILCAARHARAIDKAVWPGLQGAPVMSMIAARAVVFREAASEEFRGYQHQVLKNAQALAGALGGRGVRLVTGGTDNHLLVLDLRGWGITGAEAERTLGEIGILTNRSLIPCDPQASSGTSGLRIGTPASTTRGMKEREMEELAAMIEEALRTPLAGPTRRTLGRRVRDLAGAFPLRDPAWWPAS